MSNPSPSRRDVLSALFKASAGAVLLPLVSCTDRTVGTVGPDASGTTDGGITSCSTIPEETAGPYPGDGTNGKNALTLDGIVRSDLTTSLGSSGVASGIPLAVTITLVDAATCEPLIGHAVYAWHADQRGNYSMYSAATVNETYLRGVQVTEDSGQVTFHTVFPGCYDGRWPHIHFEVYTSLAAATTGRNAIATSQLALPKATCDLVYATTGYETSVTNLARTSLATDLVFADDGAVLQLPAVSGTVAAGFAAHLVVAVTG